TARSWDWTGKDLVWELESAPSLSDLPSFQGGCFYIQDPSTLLSVQMLDPKPGEKVLDLCAAPGGKTTYIAQKMRDQGRIVAEDLQQSRWEQLRENCARAGVRSAETALVQAEPTDAAEGEFDRVLVDAPCSNTGVMRRRVDLRWRIRPEEIERL